jgi:PIN domain nuclease of toxin-antitoxin system
MTLLLDTHAFLWFVTGDRRLSSRSRAVIEQEDSRLLLSAASVWEMAIKSSLGRLSLPSRLEDYVAEKVGEGFEVLPIDWTHAAGVERLPFHHRDPFDRLLVAQSLAEGVPIVTRDRVFRKYGVRVVW